MGSYILILMMSSAAGAETLGYKVRFRSQTLIQIARDVYKDEREWKDLAYWNGLKPPYSLSVGQILLLKKPPVAPLAQENLVTGKALESIQPNSSWPSVARQIEKDGQHWIYIVNERAPSLMMIARELYGDASMAKEISAGGGFEPDEKLRLGQRLRLKTAPKKTEAEGNAILIQNWQARGNDVMVERLGGSLASAPPVPHKAESAATEPAATKPAAVKSSSSATSTASAGAPASPDRAPASSDRAPASRKGSDEKIPTAHKTETYWLGDDARRLLDVIDYKLRSIKGNKSPPQ